MNRHCMASETIASAVGLPSRNTTGRADRIERSSTLCAVVCPARGEQTKGLTSSRISPGPKAAYGFMLRPYPVEMVEPVGVEPTRNCLQSRRNDRDAPAPFRVRLPLSMIQRGTVLSDSRHESPPNDGHRPCYLPRRTAAHRSSTLTALVRRALSGLIGSRPSLA